MVNEILAKLNMNEKIIGGGAAAILVGWILGIVLTGISAFGVTGAGSWYGSSGAQGTGIIALLAGIAAVVVIYLKYAPNMKIAWPAPIPMILLVIAAIAAIAGLLGLFQAFTYDPFAGLCTGLLSSACGALPSKPITLYVAALLVLAGGGAMAYGAYMEYTANKTAV